MAKRESFSQKQFLFDRSFWSVNEEDEHFADQGDVILVIFFNKIVYYIIYIQSINTLKNLVFRKSTFLTIFQCEVVALSQNGFDLSMHKGVKSMF